MFFWLYFLESRFQNNDLVVVFGIQTLSSAYTTFRESQIQDALSLHIFFWKGWILLVVIKHDDLVVPLGIQTSTNAYIHFCGESQMEDAFLSSDVLWKGWFLLVVTQLVVLHGIQTSTKVYTLLGESEM